MNRVTLKESILQKKSYLCVGLDSEISKLPKSVLSDPNPQLAFNRQIIHSTQDLAVAYKVNTAFYESQGEAGWTAMRETRALIPPHCLTIADAKRGDIGNTSRLYAKAIFEDLNYDAITVAPYMGIDSVQPFLDFDHKWVIILALTSNRGSRDFQLMKLSNGLKLYEQVLNTIVNWGTDSQIMFVVGATHPELIRSVRKWVPDHFLLVPGVGHQGGSLAGISQGMNEDVGLLVNSSRGIIFADDGEHFAEGARTSAKRLQEEMECLLDGRFS